MYRIKKRLTVFCAILIAARLIGEICYQGISSTAFIYAMVLVCIHLDMTERPLNEEAL